MASDSDTTPPGSNPSSNPAAAGRPWNKRRILVTGASSGIGADVARRLRDLGAHVVLTGLRMDALQEIAGDTGHTHVLPCDLTDRDARGDLVARAAKLTGGLDGLVASAGVISHEPLGAITEDHLRRQLEVNLVASLRLAEQALAHLDDGSNVVFLSSVLSRRPIPTSVVYSATKAGLEAVVKIAALAGAERRITFNAIAPGVVDTPMVASPSPDPIESEQYWQAMTALHPIGRVGQPGDITGAVLYCLETSWTTGATLDVDGGFLVRP